MNRKDQRGAALVELALTLFLLVLMVFGITEFGRALYIRNTLTNAAREGARLAALSKSTTLDVTTLTTQIKGTIPANILNDGVNVDIQPQSNLVPQSTQVTVTVSQTFKCAVPNLFPGLNSIVLKGQAAMMYE